MSLSGPKIRNRRSGRTPHQAIFGCQDVLNLAPFQGGRVGGDVNPGLKPWAEASSRFAAANVPPSGALQALCDSHHRATGGSSTASRQLASNLAPFQGGRIGGDVNPGLKPWATQG